MQIFKHYYVSFFLFFHNRYIALMRYVMVYLVKILYVVFIIVDLVRFVIMINSQFQ